eukprot:jgi/Tetstr1/454791/TSEL_041671.t1
MEAVDDGHRFRLAYFRKHEDTQMHNGDTFAFDVARERYLRPGTENFGRPEFTDLLELYKDRAYDANIASTAKTPARHHFGSGNRPTTDHDNNRDRGGSGSNIDNFSDHATGARGGGGATNHLCQRYR